MTLLCCSGIPEHTRDRTTLFVMATGTYENYWTRREKKLEERRAARKARLETEFEDDAPVCPVPTKAGGVCQGTVTKTGLCGLHQHHKDSKAG